MQTFFWSPCSVPSTLTYQIFITTLEIGTITSEIRTIISTIFYIWVTGKTKQDVKNDEMILLKIMIV